MTWHKGFALSEITDTVIAKDIAGLDVAFVQTENGIHAFINSCTHLEFPLDGCQTEDNQLECPWHRAVFEFPNGNALAGPCDKNLAVLSTKVKDNFVYVDIAND